MRAHFHPFRLAETDLFRNRIYRRLWISILLSAFGEQVTMLALPLSAALLLYATPTQMGLLTAVEVVPFVLFSLPSGVWLDYKRKLPVYLLGQLSIACMLATVPLVWRFGWLSVRWLYLVAFVIGTVNTVVGSARQIILTQIVPRARLVEAHARTSLASSTAEISGPGLAGALIKAMGPPVALLADAALLITSAFVLRGLPLQDAPSATRDTFWPALRAGLHFVRTHSLLSTMAIYVGAWQMCNGAAQAVQILIATRLLALSERDVGLSYAALGVGTVTAGAVGSRLAERIGPGPSLILGLAVCGLGWLVLALAPSTHAGGIAFAAMLFMFGIGAVLIFVNFIALRQSVTPDQLLGRMNSTIRWLILLPYGPGALLGGWLGAQLGLRFTMGLSGATAVLLALIAMHRPTIYGVKSLSQVRVT